jgi:tRNA nucleotidyltransferase (CCA-adding enzyme)
MNVKFYQVGGCVRDRMLGIPSKDIDYSVEAPSYEAMREAIVARCGSESAIKVEKPEFVTIRAVDPKLGGVDFVLCRKEGAYSDGRRPDSVEIGELEDDLARRDFTVNAMAIDDDNNLIDLFGGRVALWQRRLTCVGGVERLAEDSLRMIRAIRFSITKDFWLDDDIEEFLHAPSNARLLENISIERIREELLKCFKHNTYQTLHALNRYHWIEKVIFVHMGLKLEPTLKS